MVLQFIIFSSLKKPAGHCSYLKNSALYFLYCKMLKKAKYKSLPWNIFVVNIFYFMNKSWPSCTCMQVIYQYLQTFGLGQSHTYKWTWPQSQWHEAAPAALPNMELTETADIANWLWLATHWILCTSNHLQKCYRSIPHFTSFKNCHDNQ